MKQIRLSFSFLILLLAFSHSIATDVGNGLKPFHSATKSRIAFLVGINSYKATTSLKYAVGDSDAIEDLLLRTGKYDKLIKLNDYGKITTTLNPENQSYISKRIKMAPTKMNIEAIYQEILADNPDTLLFYYSGHGFIEGEGGENYIAPKDVDVKFEKRKVGKEEKEVPVPLNGISLKSMGIQAAKVKRVVFLIDACRSPLPEADGESGEKGEKALSANSQKEKEENIISKEIQLKQNIISIKTEKLPKRVLEAEGITMLIGAAPEVSSLEDEDFKSGIFTHFLKKAFNGGVQEENQEEYITEENLSRYIEDRFKQYYELRRKESETAAEPKLYNLTFDRGKKGEILISQHRPIEGKERIDKPIYTDRIRKREVKGKLVYNEKGEREDLRFFVHDKKRDLYYPDSLDGVYKMEYGFNKDKSGELEKFTATEFNLENEEVFEYGTRLIPDVGWEYKGIYNNTVETGLRQPGRVSTSVDTEKIRFEKKIFDFNGNIISEEYFDANGRPLEFEGVSRIVRAYDKLGQVVLEEFYSKDILDEYGDVAEKGNLIAKDGFARYKAKYKSKGNLLSETWEDEYGKIVNTQFGYAKTKYIYDKNERLIRKKFYDLENKPTNDKWGVSVYSYSYDSNCIGFYESTITEITKKENKQALTDWKLGKYKLCLAEEIHTDKDGKPANDENQIYKRVRSFNKNGYLVFEENFRADGRRHLDTGVAKVEYAHDKEGNIISRKNFGEFEVNKKPVPVSDGNGVHEYRYTYQKYFNYDGKPILNECIYHRKEKGVLLEPYGCAFKVEHFGIDDKPIEDKRNVFRTNIYYTGAYQLEADRHYYALDNKNLSVEKKAITYNPFGQVSLDATYEMKEGKVVLVSKQEYNYDEKNNNTQFASYDFEEGREFLFTKYEAVYDEKNNNTRFVRYIARKGKKDIVTKEEYEYDLRKNKIGLVSYEIKEGREVPIAREIYKYDNKNNKTLFLKFEIKEEKDTLVWKEEFAFDEKNNMTLYATYKTRDGKEVLVSKYESQYDKNNNKTLDVRQDVLGGMEVRINKSEYKFDENNDMIFEASYETKGGKEALIRKIEYKYIKKKNDTIPTKAYWNNSSSPLEIRFYQMKDGKEILDSKSDYHYNEDNKKVLEEGFKIIDGKEVLSRKNEYKYDENKNKILEAGYKIIDGKIVLVSKNEFKYHKNQIILDAKYEVKEGKEVLVSRSEYEYDEKNNTILDAKYESEDGNEVLSWKNIYKYDANNNVIMFSSYETEGGKEILANKYEYNYDDKNNLIFSILYNGKNEDIKEKIILDYRLESFSNVTTLYLSKINQLEKKLRDLNNSIIKKDESEKKSLNQKLEDLKKEFEAKKKKYTLTEEKFGKNEKLEYASYKLLFFNPRGPAEKRLMRVDLDRFYRPVKVGFEEE